MCKENDRLIYMAKAHLEMHIISDKSHLNDNAKIQEKEDNKMIFFVWGNPIFCVMYSYKLIDRFSYTFAG
jgi:hypothetical protein